MNDVESRLQLAESILAIKALSHRYSNLCDRGFDPDRISALFVDDGVWDGGEIVGRFEGREAIRTFLAGLAKVVTWSGHFVVNDEFEVTGGVIEVFGRSDHEGSGRREIGCIVLIDTVLRGRRGGHALRRDPTF